MTTRLFTARPAIPVIALVAGLILSASAQITSTFLDATDDSVLAVIEDRTIDMAPLSTSAIALAQATR